MARHSLISALFALFFCLSRASQLQNVSHPLRPSNTGSFGNKAPAQTVTFRAAALLTIFAADKKTIILAGNANCPAKEIFTEKQLISNSPMVRHGPRYLCTYKDVLLVVIAEDPISGYHCTSLSNKDGCLRQSLWWSVWYKWNLQLPSMGITADDIRLNRQVTMSAKEYSNLIRIFWRAYYDNNLPVETTTVHGIHGHSMPKRYITVPKVSRGGGAFGSPVWHGKEDPCVADTLDILYRYKNLIPRPCKPIVYDGSGFYVSNPDLLSSTTLGPECDHTCGFRYYWGNKSRGQIVAFQTTTKDLANPHSIEGAVLDHF